MIEQLKARIAELEKQKEQMLANFHAISGAIAENQAWLRELEKPLESAEWLKKPVPVADHPSTILNIVRK